MHQRYSLVRHAACLAFISLCFAAFPAVPTHAEPRVLAPDDYLKFADVTAPLLVFQ
jgi:hypothetical protein